MVSLRFSPPSLVTRRRRCEYPLLPPSLTFTNASAPHPTHSYIQDRIRQNSATITKYLTAKDEKDKGYFALCGPTWPVPDVTQALLDGFVDQGIAADIAPETLEALKEEERYILEVY